MPISLFAIYFSILTGLQSPRMVFAPTSDFSELLRKTNFIRLVLRLQPDNLRCGGIVPQSLDILRSDPS